jgi:hypothetical protein
MLFSMEENADSNAVISNVGIRIRIMRIPFASTRVLKLLSAIRI